MTRRALRAWLGLWIVAMLATTYIAGWVYYATMHQRVIGQQLAPGEGAFNSHGVHLRIVSIHQSREIAGQWDTYRAAPGATWVIVTFEGTRTADDWLCNADLIGQHGQRWEYTTKVSGRERAFSCMDFVPGEPTLGETIFEIPESEANRLMGLSAFYERDRFFRQLILRP
ncbi:MAG: hypothetical protein Q4F67_01730 [Propionibacteriaceae bacterium]|nr:hypothetical protein [Propionibacteriaceae bacterium]